MKIHKAYTDYNILKQNKRELENYSPFRNFAYT